MSGGRYAVGTVCLLITTMLAGCGSSNAPTGKVTGKVTAEGKTVDGGTLMFLPAEQGGPSGRPAAGEIKSDGTYKLTTFNPDDGALIGKHNVSFSPPVIESTTPLQPGESGPQHPLTGYIPKQKEVEVKAGSNTIDVELIPDPNPMPMLPPTQ